MNEKEIFEKWLCAKEGLTFSDCAQKYSNKNDQFADLLSYDESMCRKKRELIYRNNDYLINLAGGQTYLLNYNRYTFEGDYYEPVFPITFFYYRYKNVKEMVLTFQEMEKGKWLEDNKLQFILSVARCSYTNDLPVCDYKSFLDCTFLAKMNGKRIGRQRFRLGCDSDSCFVKNYEYDKNFDKINCLALVDSFLKEGELKMLYDKFIKRSVELPEPFFNLDIDNEIKEVRNKQLAKKSAEIREKCLKKLKSFLFLPWTICKLPWRAVKGIYNAYCRWQIRTEKEEAKKAKWFE